MAKTRLTKEGVTDTRNFQNASTDAHHSSSLSRVRMLTLSEQESLRLDDLLAHKRMQELIAESKKNPAKSIQKEGQRLAKADDEKIT